MSNRSIGDHMLESVDEQIKALQTQKDAIADRIQALQSLRLDAERRHKEAPRAVGDGRVPDRHANPARD